MMKGRHVADSPMREETAIKVIQSMAEGVNALPDKGSEVRQLFEVYSSLFIPPYSTVVQRFNDSKLNIELHTVHNTVPLVHIIYDIVFDLADPSSKTTNDRIC